MFTLMKSALLVVLGTLLVSCSPHRTALSPRQAPVQESDLGWIAQNLQSKTLQKLSINPQLQVMPISEARGLYEIHGLKQQDILDLKYENPDLVLQKNKFVYFEQETENNSEVECLGFTDGAPIAAPNSVRLGQTVELTQSEPIEKWNIHAPLGSKVTQEHKATKSFSFTPDMVGWFDITLLKQQADKSCIRHQASILVTNNPAYEPEPNKFQDWTLLGDLPWHLIELQAKEIWQKVTGKNMVVAVLDSGINYQHRLLKNKIAINKKEIPNNGIDDDQNGYVDDVIGYDFMMGDAYPFDEEGHGSHVSGLIVADQIGLAPDAKILPLKAVSRMRSDYASLAAAIYYAIDAKVRILNISAGQTNTPLSEVVIEALKVAEQQGILVVVAAGNGETGFGIDIDRTPVYPASLGLKNMLVVSAYDRDETLAHYANFGAKSVQVLAPGGLKKVDPLLSCYVQNPSHIELVHEEGTSMATPLVSASAALLLEKHPEYSAQEVIKKFIASGEPVEDLVTISVSGKKFRPLLSF